MNIESIHKLFLQHPIICTDTRRILPQSIFFALKGETFNGNTFAEQALASGCAYAVVDEDVNPDNQQLIKVENVLETLQQLATFHRNHLNIPVIGITGSNGKTTHKELIARVLQQRFKTFATKGNLNNHIGVPLSLLSLTHEHEIAVIEMGANHQGEIHQLSNICLPNYGLITNIGKAHLEGFGGEEGVIKGKSELYKFIRKTNGLLFINEDDELLKRLSKGIDSSSYGTKSSSACRGILHEENPNIDFSFFYEKEEFRCTSSLSGRYNFYNIMAAVAIGIYFRVKPSDIKHAIESYVSDNNRSQLVKTDNNLLYLDAYNANPSSMQAAIENFAASPYTNKVAILGGMNELGETSMIEHEALVAMAASKDFSKIILVGHHFENINVGEPFMKVANVELLKEMLRSNQVSGASILIKGSRTNKLEQLVEVL
jgi:UDP-N-acetylmuramoyl-tripeptide--D-alanyl-D-alanine ligase